MKAFLIAEKPSLMNDIRSAYNKHKREIAMDIDFVALHGHVLRLKDPKEIDKKYEKWNLDDYPVTFPYEYTYSRTDAGLMYQIQNAINSSDYDVIIHAGDPDQEGQLLVDELLLFLGNKKPVLRFWTSNTTEAGIIEGLKDLKPNEEYHGFYEAALLRQHLDYQMGMNMTVASTVKFAPYKTVFRLGRVKAAILSLITEREKKIREFVPSTSYKKAFSYQPASTSKPDEFVNKEEHKTNSFELPTSATVSSVSLSKKTVKAPKLFKLSSLQVECYKQFGWSADKTLDLLCHLYEAHLVSYPRTDCEYLSTDTNLVAILGRDYPKTDKDYFNDRAIASEGHTAIIPTGIHANISGEHKKLYDLIYRRLCAIFAPPKKTSTVKVVAVANNEDFTWSYTWNLDDGFETILDPQYKPPTPYNDRYKEKMVLSPIKGFAKECTTKPPARFNQGSLIEYLDMKTEIDGVVVEFSLGTSATRAKIIKECVDNGYFDIKKGVYYPTDLAFSIMDAVGNLPIFDYKLSAQWERNFKAIQRGEATASEDYFLKLTHDMVNSIKKDPRSRQGGTKTAVATSLLCPHCHQPLVAKTTKTKKHIFTHEQYPNDCDFTFWRDFCGATFSEKEVQKFFNGEVVEKRLISNKKKPWFQKLRWNGNGFDFVS